MLQQLQKKFLGATIPIINVHGPITSDCTERVAKRLSKISTSTATALAVSVNSPGGLAVQSQIIASKIREFANKHNLKVHMFARDLAASGGYLVLCTGHHVVADKTSLVGNIGVIVPKVQLQGLLDITSIEHKELSSHEQSVAKMLNPFHNINEEEKQKVLETCGWVHEKFIEHVRKHRAGKVKDDGKIFSGEIYTGEEAARLGLVDEVGSMIEVLEKTYPGCKIHTEKSNALLGMSVLGNM